MTYDCWKTTPPDDGREPGPRPTFEEEYWHQRAHRFETALHQIKTVCADNAAPTCRHDMALNFVAQVATAALHAEQRDV